MSGERADGSPEETWEQEKQEEAPKLTIGPSGDDSVGAVCLQKISSKTFAGRIVWHFENSGLTVGALMFERIYRETWFAEVSPGTYAELIFRKELSQVGGLAKWFPTLEEQVSFEFTLSSANRRYPLLQNGKLVFSETDDVVQGRLFSSLNMLLEVIQNQHNKSFQAWLNIREQQTPSRKYEYGDNAYYEVAKLLDSEE